MAAIYSLVLLLLCNVHFILSLDIVALGRELPLIGQSFYVLDDTAAVLSNLTVQQAFYGPVSVSANGTFYCLDQSAVSAYDPSNNSMHYNVFNVGYPVPGFGLFAYSSALSSLIVTTNLYIYKINGYGHYTKWISVDPPLYLMSNNVPFMYFDDASSLIYYPIINYTNKTQFIGVFDASKGILVITFPLPQFTRQCSAPALVDSGTSLFVCFDYGYGFYTYNVGTGNFTMLPINLNTYFSSNVVNVKSTAYSSSTSLLYAAVELPYTKTYLISIDFNSNDYTINTLGAMPSGMTYSMIGLYNE